MKKFYCLLVVLVAVVLSGCKYRLQIELVENTEEITTPIPTVTPVPTSTTVPTPTPTVSPTHALSQIFPQEPDWADMQKALKALEENPYTTSYTSSDGEKLSMHGAFMNENSVIYVSIDFFRRTLRRSSKDTSITTTEYIDILGWPDNYKFIDIVHTPQASDDFSIVYDEATEEAVCVRFSKELGKRTKISKELMERYFKKDGTTACYPYVVEDENGNISFNISFIEDNVEELTNCFTIFPSFFEPYTSLGYNPREAYICLNEIDEQFHLYPKKIYVGKDGAIFTFSSQNEICGYYPYDGYYLNGYKFPYFYGNAEIEKVEFKLEELTNFTLSTSFDEFQAINCTVKIDDNHELFFSFPGYPFYNKLTEMLDNHEYSDYIRDSVSGGMVYIIPTYSETISIIENILCNPILQE